MRKAYASSRKELIIIYGRRRIGKTTLVRKSVENVNHIYLFAEETLEEENLKTFRSLVAKADLSWESFGAPKLLNS
ncbi:ATP-binding protein [Thermococcus argininiproducens]|uniref:ATP-binding protein n=1 Tax=Thermococcus argininiproducens TaxID=2866384 RepID=UPI002073431D|nr:ATP-binding protein [Thermococcus argininiproducens]